MAVVTLSLVVLVARLGYKEDISDFLPLDGNHQRAMQVYQDISGADRLFAVFQYADTTTADADEMVAAVEAFVAEVERRDTAHTVKQLTAQVDMAQMAEITDFAYANIPYFLTPADYDSIADRLQRPGYIRQQLQEDKRMLMFPAAGLLSENIQRDPLNIFTPTISKLQRSVSGLRYELYDGYIFTPDLQRAIVMLRSPYGSSETENNGQLIALLDNCGHSALLHHPNIRMHLVGGPSIAVGNASQIKADSILSVAIAVVLILILLYYSLRNVRHLLLIAISIGWGWLFAMGCLSLVHDNVSIIVIGISSVIIGIAVNYPLHLIAHLSHTPSVLSTLREIAAPLIVGNITTVGAFLALVPLRSVALRDLGLFSAFLLVGTILFVLVFLPHIVKPGDKPRHTFINRIGDFSLDNKPWVVAVVAVLTVVFGYYSLQTTFDANISHINYMTDDQRADMDYFQRMMASGTEQPKVYSLSTAATLDEALDSCSRRMGDYRAMKDAGWVADVGSCWPFLCSTDEQRQRLERWNSLMETYRSQIEASLRQQAKEEGFSADSFDDFFAILDRDYQPQKPSYFAPLLQTVFASNVVKDAESGQYSVVDVLSVNDVSHIERVEAALAQSGGYGFDIQGMNTAIANHLSDDFNYIGWACGCIVFFFLWLSFGSLELAALSFLPMAVSWLWILGIMTLCGLQFNIVNVILATFIFGQGDDYTIFMTEGACYEYAYRRKMLSSYKHSIIISALIMFIGIGTLIIARHPALRSLAEVTIAGMFSVVLMAYLFPPLIFRWLVSRHGQYRQRPLSLRLLWERMFRRGDKAYSEDESRANLVCDRYRYKGEGAYAAVRRNMRRTNAYAEWLKADTPLTNVVIEGNEWGELALLYALRHPEKTVTAVVDDADRATFIRYCAEGVADNVRIAVASTYQPPQDTYIINVNRHDKDK